MQCNLAKVWRLDVLSTQFVFSVLLHCHVGSPLLHPLSFARRFSDSQRYIKFCGNNFHYFVFALFFPVLL